MLITEQINSNQYLPTTSPIGFLMILSTPKCSLRQKLMVVFTFKNTFFKIINGLLIVAIISHLCGQFVASGPQKQDQDASSFYCIKLKNFCVVIRFK